MELKDDWLVAELQRVGWNSGSRPQNIRKVDRYKDHRLVEISFITPGGYSAKARILHGFDRGDQFWIRVILDISTTKEAISWLTPKSIQHCQEKNIPVVRQGDWFFVKKQFKPKGIIRENVFYGSHQIEEWCDGYARGRVTHNMHSSLYLDGWHLPVRCRGWHTLSVSRPIHNQAYWKKHIEHSAREKSLF